MTAQLPAWKTRLDALQINDLKQIFRASKPVIGMVHCWPLPGAPGYTGYGMQTIIDNALRDAHALAEGGCDGIIVENMWDIPFRAGPNIQPESIAAQAVVAAAVKREIALPMGINLVHNGGVSLLGIAIASGAEFIRVCIICRRGRVGCRRVGQGCAADLVRRRRAARRAYQALRRRGQKHSVRFPSIDLATHISGRASSADALIVSGRMTGDAPDLGKVRRPRP